MIPEYYWKATSVFFSYADWVMKFPLQWNSESNLFYLREYPKRHYLIWCLVNLLLLGGLGNGALWFCVYLRVFIEPKESFTPLHALIYVILSIISSFPLLIVVGFVMFRRVTVTCLNELILVERDLMKLQVSIQDNRTKGRL